MKDIRDDELLIIREFDAPVALVFRLWEDRHHMLRWWGPEEFTTVELDWELTPGRRWGGAMTSRHYGLSRFAGIIREVERNRRIVFTFQTFHQTPFSTVAIRDSHVGGWNSLFNKQQIYVENIAFAVEKGLKP